MRYTTRVKANAAIGTNTITPNIFVKRKLVVTYSTYYALIVEVFFRPANNWVITCFRVALVAWVKNVATFELDGNIICIGMVMLAPAVFTNDFPLDSTIFGILNFFSKH